MDAEKRSLRRNLQWFRNHAEGHRIRSGHLSRRIIGQRRGHQIVSILQRVARRSGVSVTHDGIFRIKHNWNFFRPNLRAVKILRPEPQRAAEGFDLLPPLPRNFTQGADIERRQSISFINDVARITGSIDLQKIRRRRPEGFRCRAGIEHQIVDPGTTVFRKIKREVNIMMAPRCRNRNFKCPPLLRKFAILPGQLAVKHMRNRRMERHRSADGTGLETQDVRISLPDGIVKNRAVIIGVAQLQNVILNSRRLLKHHTPALEPGRTGFK